MARPAPAIDRAAAVIGFLARNPGHSYTLSELSRQLELNKATCHAMLAALESHGLLQRDSATKGYALGPTLIALAGAVAPAATAAVEVAADEMAAIVEETGLACYASTRIGDEVVVLGRRLPVHGYVPPTGRIPQVGRRTEWIAPIAPLFAAWGRGIERDAWIDSAPGADERARLVELLDELRRQGYDMSLATDPRSRILAAVSDKGIAESTNVREVLAALLDGDAMATPPVGGTKLPIRHISAPVFAVDTTVLLTLSVDGFRGPKAPGEVRVLADRLLRAANDVTRVTHGRFPAEWLQRDTRAATERRSTAS